MNVSGLIKNGLWGEESQGSPGENSGPATFEEAHHVFANPHPVALTDGFKTAIALFQAKRPVFADACIGQM